MVLFNLIRSELAKHNILLSSNTVFMFSIHKASTGPSHTIHLWSSVVSWRKRENKLKSSYKVFTGVTLNVIKTSCLRYECLKDVSETSCVFTGDGLLLVLCFYTFTVFLHGLPTTRIETTLIRNFREGKERKGKAVFILF